MRTNGKILTAIQWISLLLFRRALITETHIVLRQAEGWVYLPKAGITALKSHSVSKTVVRLYDGRRFVVNLFEFPLSTYSRVMHALDSALHENRRRRGLWKGAGPGD